MRILANGKIRSRLLKALAVIFAAGFVINFSYFHAPSVAALSSGPCLDQTVQNAEARISNVYSSPKSNPIKLCLDKPSMGLDVPYGTTRFSPFLSPINIMGPKGQNVDVTAHEWLHAEIASQLGFITRNYKLPTWMDEGLAMQVDNRSDYSDVSLRAYLEDLDLNVPALEDISKPKNFYTMGDQGKLHYALARCVVAQSFPFGSQMSFKNYLDMTRQYSEKINQAYIACTNKG